MLTERHQSPPEDEKFKQLLESSYDNYAYDILLLQIVVEDDHYIRKPRIDQISKLIQLYMLAVEVLESASDQRFQFFNRKIQSLMMKKHIVEQMHIASGKKVDEKTYQACNKFQLGEKKNQHQIQIYFNQADSAKIQDIIKKSEMQMQNLNKNINTNLKTQEKTLEERIQIRKMKSESGSISKFKMGSHNVPTKEGVKVQKKVDVRMEYFDDYSKENPLANSNPRGIMASGKSIRQTYGSVERVLDRKLKQNTNFV